MKLISGGTSLVERDCEQVIEVLDRTEPGARAEFDMPAPAWSRRSRQLLASLAFSLATVTLAQGQSTQLALDEHDGDWQMVDEMDFGAIFIDGNRVQAIEADVYQVRTLWRFASVQHNHEGSAYGSSVAVRAIDCRAGAMAILAYANQDGGGVVNRAARTLPAADWQPIRDDSPIGRIADHVCEGSAAEYAGPALLAGGG